MRPDSVAVRPVRARRVTSVAAGFVGDSPAVRACFDLITRAAEADVPVLFLGERGVGKRFFAKYLHQMSPRRERPLFAVSGMELRDGGILRLFSGSEGVFEQADGGSLFFSDLEEMPVGVQKELHAFLEGSYVAGSKKGPGSGVRILAGIRTVRDAAARMFSERLLNIVGEAQIRIPTLRERREDIPELARQAMERSKVETGKNVRGFSPGALDFLNHYDFPGNIEELLRLVHRAVSRAGDDVVYREDFGFDELSALGELPPTLAEMERRHINQVLTHTGWNRHAAARLLGIPVSTLVRKIRLHGLADC